MKKTNRIDFKIANNDFELLDRIRLRHQMYANDIRTLSGILTGCALAHDDYEQNIKAFAKHLTDSRDENPYAVSWVDIIEREAERTEYEIPMFYTHLDHFRGIEIDVVGEVVLSWENRDFAFRKHMRTVNIDYPTLPIQPPHTLKAVKSPSNEVHAFYCDENDLKYYEECLRDFSRLKKWAKECFDIDQRRWGGDLEQTPK